ncbi:AsmA family protein [Streptomyces stelliscabiei]|uniref:hypothetical protein n=1 Tax=Streptomyces stelliscabiei TaxID=146820 RepID=UPI0029BF2921|nr:hypothetical protein [Streptomyces stelliscabiei]MDX2557730.1 hypothetical protein [Streptomyces stelliscabiei]MDX2617436.1 hypothetical protein [Streptomyces stelliscabiei]MDX2641577.1 hypothetical protein [Streptomyces stelliscabiei]MDX2667548.1 hypothetical protein [Streptomyces stelliscabiei]MDX2715844.1 hypothetical protein [Streptomyces stelliscabiei]
MANFLDDQTDAKRLAQLLDDYDRRLKALERTTQASYTSIEGGSLDIYDDEGVLKGSVGVQPDGGVALVPVNTTPPPTPTAPTVEAVLAGLLVGWDGQWDDAYTTPTDFSLVQVHVSTTAEFTPDLTTHVATITAQLGGTVTIAIEGYDTVWVRLVGQNTGSLTGSPSVAVQGQPRQAVEQDLIDGMVTEKKLAESAVTAAKIALGAVGTTALADGAVLEDKLAKAAVTLGKIANGAVTINALGGTLSDSAAQRYVDTMNDPAAWTVTDKGTGATWEFLTGVADAPTSQRVGQSTGYNRLQGTTTIPYEPGVLYRLSARVRLKAGTSDTFYVGIAGIGADGTTLVNRMGVAGSPNSHYYVAASGRAITQADGWVTVVGFVKDRAATGSAGPNNDPRSPGLMHNDVRFIAPYVWLNYTGLGATSTNVMQVDCVTLEALKTGIVDSVNITAGAVNTAALAADAVTAGKVAADAISARELQANSVTALELAAGSVTANAVAAGAITTDKLTVTGGSNILPDPSFESAVTASLILGLSYATQDKTKGNGSAASLKIDGRSATALYRDVPLTLIPALPGDQFYLATDYFVSADWVGTSLNIHARWEDAAGAIVGYGVVGTTGTPVREAWARISGTVTAPAGTVRAAIRVQTALTTAGDTWYDNAAVRPVVPGVQIADGGITAPKILAGAVTTDTLLALAVTAEKIASLAITTDKLNALAVTADKLAVNSVTATKIAAGVIDATHVKAGSLTADRLAIGADGGNLIADPSFEGAVSVQRVSGRAAWTLVAGGNGTAQALRQDATNTDELPLVGPIPATPGQKMYLAIDYNASSDYVGEQVLIYAEWQDASGTAIDWANVTTGAGPVVRGAWARIAGIGSVVAPSGTARVVVRLKSFHSTAGSVLWDNAVARFVTASGYAGARAELSPLGLQLYDEEGEEAVALLTGRPNYLTLSADGVPVATIDQEGKAGFQSLAIAEGLTVGGDDIASILDQRPRGIVAYGVPATTVTSTGTEIGLFELPATIVAGRMYRIKFHATADFDTASDGEARVYLRDGGASTPSINSTLRQHVVLTPSHTGRYWTAELEHIVPASALGAGLHRFLISFENTGGTTGQTFELGLPTTGRSCYFIVEDIGPEIPKTGGNNTGGGTAAPPVIQYTKTYSATWSGSYASRGSYNSYFGNSCYQGYYSSTNGMQASLIGFASSLGTDLSGATIQKAEVYLYFDHWYSNSGGKAVIKAHKHTSRPSTFSCDAESKTVTWAKNEGKWVDITSVFDSTTWRGIALDPNTSGLTYYGRARGYGQTNPPKLRVTYTK